MRLAKNFALVFVLTSLIGSTSYAQYPYDQNEYFYPEMAMRNGFQGHELKVPNAKNLIGVWKRIGTASFIMSDPHASPEAFYADTIVFANVGTAPDKVSAMLIRGNQKTTILDVEFEDKKMKYEYEHEIHYSLLGYGKTKDGWKRLHFYDYEYPRMVNYNMASIDRFSSIGDKYLVLYFTTHEEDWEVRSEIYEGFVKVEKGSVMPKFNEEAYNRE